MILIIKICKVLSIKNKVIKMITNTTLKKNKDENNRELIILWQSKNESGELHFKKNKDNFNRCFNKQKKIDNNKVNLIIDNFLSKIIFPFEIKTNKDILKFEDLEIIFENKENNKLICTNLNHRDSVKLLLKNIGIFI